MQFPQHYSLRTMCLPGTYFWHLCWKSLGCWKCGLFFGSPVCPTGPPVYFCRRTVNASFTFWNWTVWYFQPWSFCSRLCWYSLRWFHSTFRSFLLVRGKTTNTTGTTLHLQIPFVVWVLTILILIHEYRTPFHLFVTCSKSYINVLLSLWILLPPG